MQKGETPLAGGVGVSPTIPSWGWVGGILKTFLPPFFWWRTQCPEVFSPDDMDARTGNGDATPYLRTNPPGAARERARSASTHESQYTKNNS